jgi:predicted MFS family arabinose efflux permease
MPAAHAFTADLAMPHRPGVLSSKAAFYLLASITVSFLAGSSAPTPLYPLYQAEWGFSPITVTFVFGIYAVALLAALLVAGRLSDHIGRRPVLIAALAVQVVSMLVFATADGVAALVVGRIVQGLSTGAAIAAIGAGMLDLDKARGGIANSVAPPIGTALGGLVGGLMVHFLPAPAQLVYLVLGAIFIAQGVGVYLMAESNPPRPGALASLKPRFSLPSATRGPFLLAVPVLIAVWSLGGFYASLGPRLVHAVFGLDSSLLGGIALFVLAASGGATVLALRKVVPRSTMTFGAAALLAGTAVVVTALTEHAVVLFFLGTALAGIGFGAGFQGALRSVVALAAPRDSAGVLSLIFVVSYLAMGLPAVIAGWAVVETGNILATAQSFGVVVMALAGLALAGAVARRP